MTDLTFDLYAARDSMAQGPGGDLNVPVGRGTRCGMKAGWKTTWLPTESPARARD